MLLAAGGVSGSLAFGAAEPARRLREVAASGDVKTVIDYLDRDPASIYARNEKGQSIFLLACLAGQTEVANLLTQRGLVLDLHEAAAAGKAPRVDELLAATPGSVNHRDLLGATPFHYAVACGQIASANQLLAKGADLNTPAAGLGKATPAHLAAQHASHETAGRLAQLIVGNGADIKATREDGATALHVAAAQGHADVVRFLVRKGAPVDARDLAGKTALESAIAGGHQDAAAALGDAGSIGRDCYTDRYRGVTRDDTYGIPQAWINQFVTVSHFDFDKVKSLYARCASLLLTRATWDELPVEAAAHVGREDIANFLLEKGSPLSLCTAAMLGRIDDVRTLLAEDKNRVRDRGAHDFPLIWYTIFGKERAEIAELLLKAGADGKAGLMGGTTGIAMARKKGYNKVASLLQLTSDKQ